MKNQLVAVVVLATALFSLGTATQDPRQRENMDEAEIFDDDFLAGPAF